MAALAARRPCVSRLMRLARCEVGELEAGVEFDPCPEYGLTRPRLDPTEPLRIV